MKEIDSIIRKNIQLFTTRRQMYDCRYVAVYGR